MPVSATHVDRRTQTATVHVRGDVVIPTAPQMWGQLRGIARRRDVRTVIVDFADAGRVDSSGVAVVSLASRLIARSGKTLELANLGATHRAALELLADSPATAVTEDIEPAGWVQRAGATILDHVEAGRGLIALAGDVGRQAWAVVTRRKVLPKGAFVEHAAKMGVGALGIVGLLGALLGMTLGFQGVVLLHRFGAGVFVAGMIGLSMVREFGPMITAIVLTGRTGAAIAAELGTMRVRAEIDALSAMGVSPTRFLLLPRLLALTCVQPALTLISMLVGIGGGLLVAALALHLPIEVLWQRTVDRVTLGDFVHGLGKSVIFAWIIGLTGCHLGMRASADASSVGAATTRTVVVAVFFIILVDAIAATLASLGVG